MDSENDKPVQLVTVKVSVAEYDDELNGDENDNSGALEPQS